MINPGSYSSFNEFYEVVKTVEFVTSHGGEDRRFRINALYDPRSKSYSTSAYIREEVTLQPSFPYVNGAYQSNPQNFAIWVAFTNIGWTNRNTADEAIEQAMGFLNP